MAFELPEDQVVPCPSCGVRIAEGELASCSICHRLLCPYCAVLDFGRTFCSTRCKGFFFWGDDDEEGEGD